MEDGAKCVQEAPQSKMENALRFYANNLQDFKVVNERLGNRLIALRGHEDNKLSERLTPVQPESKLDILDVLNEELSEQISTFQVQVSELEQLI